MSEIYGVRKSRPFRLINVIRCLLRGSRGPFYVRARRVSASCQFRRQYALRSGLAQQPFEPPLASDCLISSAHSQDLTYYRTLYLDISLKMVLSTGHTMSKEQQDKV